MYITLFIYTGMSILLSGMIPSVSVKGGFTCHGDGVYLTPSITYAAHPRYSTPKEIPEDVKSIFGSQGKWIQFVLQCRVDPNTIKVGKETLAVGDKCVIDPNYKNDEIEWVVGDTRIEYPTDPDCKVYIVGIMIRITDKHPYLMDESSWWEHVYNIYDKSYFDSYRQDKNQGIKSKIIPFK